MKKLKANFSSSCVATKSWHMMFGPSGWFWPLLGCDEPMRAMEAPSQGSVNASAPVTSVPSVWYPRVHPVRSSSKPMLVRFGLAASGSHLKSTGRLKSTYSNPPE